MKKRIVSIFMVFCMIFSLIPSSVSAVPSGEKADGSTQLREQWLKYKSNKQKATSYASDANKASSSTLSFAKSKKSSNVSRYTVLVLDTSGSMYGTPMDTCRAAAVKFCQSVLQADGTNYVAVVGYESSASEACNFTNDINVLENAISNMSAYGGTNTSEGLQYADNLLSTIPEGQGTIKNVLLLSDGMPNEGIYSSTGPYTYNDYYYYDYANAVYNTAAALKNKGYYIYTLGFFHSLYTEELDFARKFMNDLQNGGYYDVVDASKLEFVFGQIADQITKKAGTFTYASGSEMDYEAQYFYDDGYFTGDSHNYNQSLATMSLCLAMSAFGSNDQKSYDTKSANVADLLTQVGFENFRTNTWFTQKPLKDSIGVAAASKKMLVNNKNYTLLAVAVRGGGYESEWASNFTIGETGQHEGFNEAKNNVLSFIRDYISQQGITGDIKLWITGYSRAAATTNLTAGAIDSGAYLGNCSLKLSDLYAYCFETPAGAVASDARTNPLYKNIFSIINFNDPVPKVAPAALGFRRYGTDMNLPTAESNINYSTLKANMLARYYALDSTKNYVVDEFVMKKIALKVTTNLYPMSVNVTPTITDDLDNNQSQGAFLNDLINKIVKEEFKSRSNYVSTYQDGVRELFGVMNGTTGEKWDNFKAIFEAKLKSNAGWLIASTTKVGAMTLGTPADLIEKYLVESLNEAGITSYNESEIKKVAATLAATVVSFAVSHPNLTTTLISNINGIGAAHYPELCLAWLQSMDQNYIANAGQTFSNGSYRVIRINCPIDVEVYDSTNKLVAEIKGDKPQDVSGSSIISSINEDGEKLIYLPAEAGYNLKLTATGSGKMSYSINEFSANEGEVTRLVNYNDVAIKTGDLLSSNVPAYSNTDITSGAADGSSAVYTLTDANSKAISSSNDLKGNDAEAAYYMVNVTSSNENYGSVTGQGVRQLGNYAQITAIPVNGGKFEGWYVNGEKISSEASYRFRVSSDVNIVGKFTGNTPPVITGAAASIPVINQVDNKMTDIKILNVTDPDGDPVRITITGITQDEPLTNKVEGDGSGIGTDTALVRASRNEKGNGRVYKITFTANDGKGGESSGYVLVKVPGIQGKDAVVDDGQKYNSVVSKNVSIQTGSMINFETLFGAGLIVAAAGILILLRKRRKA